MKRISIVCLTGLVFFAACENTGSSTVGSWEKEGTSTSSEKRENESHEGQVKEKIESANTDTLKTPASPSLENAANITDTSVSADSMNAKP